MSCNVSHSILPKILTKFSIRNTLCTMRYVNTDVESKFPKPKSNDEHVNSFTAKDIEFCPNRTREVLQNYVVEASEQIQNEDPFAEGTKFTPSDPMSEEDHLDAYKSGNSVSLYSVMQSNVPEPFSSKSKAPTHLNMPGGSSSQGYKYLSGQMQSSHQSKNTDVTE